MRSVGFALTLAVVAGASCHEHHPEAVAVRDAEALTPHVSPAPPPPASGARMDPARADAAPEIAPEIAGGTDGGAALAYADLNHVLATGQSLATGSAGVPVLSTTQAYDNKMFVTGLFAGSQSLTSLSPLVERSVETMSTSFSGLVTRAAREELPAPDGGKRTHDLLVSVHAIASYPYAALKRGRPPYETGMAQVRAARWLARTHGLSYMVRAVTTVHGESDHVTSNPHYEADLVEWQHDYESDVNAITGRSGTLPLFETQMSSFTHYGSRTSAVAIAQLDAHVHHPGAIVLVGPKYHLPYSPDGVHLSNEGYRWMGEDYAKAYRRVVLEGRAWEPVRPIAITRSGAVVTVRFAVPEPPLVLDTTRVTDPGHFGFEWADDGPATPTIKDVAIRAPDTVSITLSAEPTGQNHRLRYAHTGLAGAPAGPRTGARGNLRDSDATRSAHGYALFNWCVHFDERAP